MNYYFMVMIDGLEGVVTLANFPPKDKQVPWPPKQIAHVLWSDGKNWQFRDLDHLEPGAFKSFKSSSIILLQNYSAYFTWYVKLSSIMLIQRIPFS